MFLPKVFTVISFILFTHVLATPHIVRPLHHRAISARLVAPIAEDQPIQPRRLSKRCKPRPSQSSSSVPHAASSSSPAEQPSPTEPHTTYTPPPPPPTTTQAHTTAAPPAPTTTKHAAVPTTTPDSGSNSGSGSNEPSFMIGLQTGEGTWYSTGLGACGITNTDADYIAAASHLLFDVFPGYNGINPNTNPICNRKVKVNYQGKTVTIAITDRCAACALTDLDFSSAAFGQLADLGVGRLFGMEWEWV